MEPRFTTLAPVSVPTPRMSAVEFFQVPPAVAGAMAPLPVVMKRPGVLLVPTVEITRPS